IALWHKNDEAITALVAAPSAKLEIFDADRVVGVILLLYVFLVPLIVLGIVYCYGESCITSRSSDVINGPAILGVRELYVGSWYFLNKLDHYLTPLMHGLHGIYRFVVGFIVTTIVLLPTYFLVAFAAFFGFRYLALAIAKNLSKFFNRNTNRQLLELAYGN